MPFTLIHTPASPELRQAIADISEGIESGDITGMGVIVMLRKRRFFVDVYGQMASFPHESRGLVAELDDCLRELGRKRRDSSTTML